MEALSLEDPVELVEASMAVTAQLEESTTDRTLSLLPSDLQTTNSIIDQVISVLENNTETLMSSDEEPDGVMMNTTVEPLYCGHFGSSSILSLIERFPLLFRVSKCISTMEKCVFGPIKYTCL